MSKATEAQAFRLGQCAAALETAKSALKLAMRTWDLLPHESNETLTTAYEIVHGVEQALWARKDKA